MTALPPTLPVALSGADLFRPTTLVSGMLEVLQNVSTAATPSEWADAWRRSNDLSPRRELLALLDPFVAAAVRAGVGFSDAAAAYEDLVAAARLVWRVAGDLPTPHTDWGAERILEAAGRGATAAQSLAAQHRLCSPVLTEAGAACGRAIERVGLVAAVAARLGPAVSPPPARGRGGRRPRPLTPSERRAVELKEANPKLTYKEIAAVVRRDHPGFTEKKAKNLFHRLQKRVRDSKARGG